MLLIIVKCEQIIQNDSKAFSKMLIQIIEESTKLKILLITDTGFQAHLRKEYNADSVHIELLEVKYAA